MDISYRQGIRSKGFAITCPTGTTQQTLSLSGLAKSFEGILITSAFTATPSIVINPKQLRVTLTINNDVAIDDDVALHYASPATGGFSGGFPFFIPIPRRLTGQDTISIRLVNAAASQNVDVTVWYRNEL